jgi:hypothetical protein
VSAHAGQLEAVLREMITEHRALLKDVETHSAAIRRLDAQAMAAAGVRQEAARSRIAVLENKRRVYAQLEARQLRISGDVTLQKIADAVEPGRRQVLIQLRDELKRVAMEIASKTHVAGKVAGAVLGHLNTAVRLISGAVEHAGTYTKYGTPRVARRIGVMEAVA